MTINPTPNIDDEIEKLDFLISVKHYTPVPQDYNVTELRLKLEDKARTAIKQLITDARTETEKAYGGCRKCYGKGYATVRKGEETMNRHYKYLNTPVRNQVNFCSCNRGKQLYEVFGYPQTKELKENKR